MWVIFCTDTGEEIDRVETTRERSGVVVEFETTNTWGYTASWRWED